MEVEIHHPPIVCPACGHTNKENAVAALIIQADSGAMNFDPSSYPENTSFMFCCGKCPKVSILEKHKFGGQIAWVVPS